MSQNTPMIGPPNYRSHDRPGILQRRNRFTTNVPLHCGDWFDSKESAGQFLETSEEEIGYGADLRGRAH